MKKLVLALTLILCATGIKLNAAAPKNTKEIAALQKYISSKDVQNIIADYLDDWYPVTIFNNKVAGNKLDIRAMAFSSDTTFLAIATEQSTDIYMKKDGKYVHSQTLKNDYPPTVNLSFSADGNYLTDFRDQTDVWQSSHITGNGTLIILERTGNQFKEIGEIRKIRNAAISPSGTYLVTLSKEYKVTLYKRINGKFVIIKELPNAIFYEDQWYEKSNKLGLFSAGENIFILPIYKGVQIYSLINDQLKYQQTVATDPSKYSRFSYVPKITLTQDDRYLAASTGARSESEALIPLYKMQDSSVNTSEIYKVLQKINLADYSEGSIGDIKFIALSPAGDYLVVYYETHPAYGIGSMMTDIWQLKNQAYEDPVQLIYVHDGKKVTDIKPIGFLPDSSLVTVVDNYLVVIWKNQKLELLKAAQAQSLAKSGYAAEEIE